MEHPIPTVGAFIFNKKGKLLLIRSHKWGNKLVCPGGKIDLGESMENAVVREVKEETGLDVHDIELINVQDMIYAKEFFKKKHYLFLDFVCKTKQESITLNEEAEEYCWVDINNLPDDLGPYTKNTLSKYLKSL